MYEHLRSVYAERNLCVSLAIKLALALGLSAGIGIDEGERDEQWKHVAFIDLPSGQVSWHIHTDELPNFGGVPLYAGVSDGHSTDLKYTRVRDPKLSPEWTL
jgi:hypothetical protein